MTEIGLLTIDFSKPLLQSLELKSLLKSGIMEIIELTVISDQYSPGSNDISIGNFTLERIEDSQVDIKISFVKPDSISVSMTSPEDLQVTFLEPWIFKDLETEIEMTKSEYTMVIPPQMSEALAAQVEAFNKAVDKPITYVS